MSNPNKVKDPFICRQCGDWKPLAQMNQETLVCFECAKLIELLRECQYRIGQMCAKGRPPKMSVPVDANDDDMFICETINRAITALMKPPTPTI